MNVLVTGTSSGFGFATAVELAQRGHRVFAGMRAPTTRRDGAAARLRDEAGARVEVLDLDVTQQASVDAAIALVAERGVELDGVVNNAGLAAGGVTESFTAEDAQRLFDVNVLGPFRVARAVLPGMRARGRGLVVNVTSTLGREILPFIALYEGTKFALEGMWEAWRYELASQHIDVVLVQPGTFPTTAMVPNMLPPSDPGRAAGYGELLPRVEKFFEGLAEYARSGQAPGPRLVAAAIADVIALPAGERPVRVVVDPNGGGGAARLNALAAKEQAAILETLGLADLGGTTRPDR
jgi:NAD(P)-dependent dehydrogenase (short-subunit alcohol dehydrogenase family)